MVLPSVDMKLLKPVNTNGFQTFYLHPKGFLSPLTARGGWSVSIYGIIYGIKMNTMEINAPLNLNYVPQIEASMSTNQPVSACHTVMIEVSLVTYLIEDRRDQGLSTPLNLWGKSRFLSMVTLSMFDHHNK